MTEITFDCALIESRQELHAAIAEKLGFPDYYGNNLDALYDCLTDISEETEIRVINFHHLEEKLGDYSKPLKKVMALASLENPALIIKFNN